MTTETDLNRLLASLDPVLHDEVLVYVTVVPGGPVPGIGAFAQITEGEGTTLIVGRDDAAEHELDSTFPCRRIELRVQSDLAAVGLTAAVAGALTEAGISANMIAAFHHDHVLVPADRADEAIEVLRELSAGATSS